MTTFWKEKTRETRIGIPLIKLAIGGEEIAVTAVLHSGTV
jgi:hypothetical protein